MQGSTTSLILYFVVFFGIMYFLMIRPQQKQRKQREALLNSIKVRDKVVTSGGIYGKIMKLKDKTVILQIADKVEIEILKSSILSVENREISTEIEKKDKKDKHDKSDKSEQDEELVEEAEVVEKE